MGKKQFNYKGRGRVCGQYILEGHRPVPCDDLLEWAGWNEQARRTGEFIVKSDMVKGAHVSTVFLGLDHGYSWLPGSRPLLFETMIFGGPMDMYRRRYSTWVGAEHGHAQALKKCIQVMNREGRRKIMLACRKVPRIVYATGVISYGSPSPKSRIKLYAASIF